MQIYTASQLRLVHEDRISAHLKNAEDTTPMEVEKQERRARKMNLNLFDRFK